MPTRDQQDSTSYIVRTPVFKRPFYEVWQHRVTSNLVVLTRWQHRMGNWGLYQLISDKGVVENPDQFRIPRSTFVSTYAYTGRHVKRVPGAGPKPARYQFLADGVR